MVTPATAASIATDRNPGKTIGPRFGLRKVCSNACMMAQPPYRSLTLANQGQIAGNANYAIKSCICDHCIGKQFVILSTLQLVRPQHHPHLPRGNISATKHESRFKPWFYDWLAWSRASNKPAD
jgi:hypothetical protein